MLLPCQKAGVPPQKGGTTPNCHSVSVTVRLPRLAWASNVSVFGVVGLTDHLLHTRLPHAGHPPSADQRTMTDSSACQCCPPHLYVASIGPRLAPCTCFSSGFPDEGSGVSKRIAG